MTDEDFRIAVQISLGNGTEGISMFKLNHIKDSNKFDILNEEIEKFKNGTEKIINANTLC